MRDDLDLPYKSVRGIIAYLQELNRRIFTSWSVSHKAGRDICKYTLGGCKKNCISCSTIVSGFHKCLKRLQAQSAMTVYRGLM